MPHPVAGESEAALEQLRAQLSPAQLEQVRARLRGPARAPRTDMIPRLAPSTTRPLSFAQRRMWYLERTLQGSPRYTIPLAFDVSGPLDTSALRSACEVVARAHSALRGVFREIDGAAATVSSEGPGVSVETRTVVASEDVDALLHRYAVQPFDLEQGPLLRVVVLTRYRDQHVLLICLHHLVADAWSIDVLFEDLREAYLAARQGRAARLPPQVVEYGDYAAWQASWLAGEEAARQLAFWRTELAVAPLVLDVAPVLARPAVQRGVGAELRRALADEVVRASTDLARAEGATLFMVLLAALAVLLSRHSGHQDIVVGVPVAGRTRTELERVVGLFVNTVPVRVVLHGRPSFRELLRRVRDATLRGYANQDIPFDCLVQQLRPERSAGRTPVVQVLADYQRSTVPVLDELVVTHRQVDTGAAKFDLSFSFVSRADNVIELLLTYDLDLFGEAAVERMAGQFTAVLQAGITGPDRPVDTLDLFPPNEQRLLDSSRGGDREVPHQGVLDRLLDRIGRDHPAGVAVSFAGTQVDDATLHRYSNHLAHRLCEEGVSAESVVGVAAERSTEMVVALLAVLKAGAAFLPLDPEGPPARLAHMVTQAQVSLILAPPGSADRLAAAGPPVHRIDVAALPDSPERSPAVEVDPDALAYVMYTSGSSGTPKGVMVSRRALANRIAWMAAGYPLRDDDAVLHKTPLTFDVSLWELFWPIAVGARLVVAEPGAHRDPRALADLIARERVTVAHFVPSLLRPFLDVVARGGRGQTLRQVFCSGEALTPDLAARLRRALPGVLLHNLYGPTEAAIEVSTWHCSDDDVDSVPIGRPAPNCRLYVLDAGLRQRPVGLPGDLYIGGVQVARGYLGRPDLTATAFLPDPFAAVPARMYRTGDRALVRADGAIEFLGRADRQVKIRGYRVELPEIEAALARCPGVGQVAVVVRDRGDSDRRIVAYLVPDGGGRPVAANELRTQLRESLPAYLLPASFVWCDQLSLTASGKLDYRALPEAGDGAPDGPSAGVELANELERQVAAVLASGLGVAGLGRHDDFFEHGGHSLLALDVVGRLSQELGVDLRPRTFLADPTVAGIARAVASASDTLAAASGVARHDTPPVLVTGAAGMIGTFVVAQLRRLGHPVRLLSRSRTQVPDGDSTDVAVVIGDLADPAALRRAAEGASGLVHLAATFGCADIDIAATAALAEAWGADLPGGFVFVSTVDVYGRPRQVPVTEEHPVDVHYSDYALSKIRGEELLLEQAARHGRNDFTILRPPYVWGPHPYCRWQLRTGAGHALYQAVRERRSLLLPGARELESAAYGHAWVDARELAGVICTSLRDAAGGVLNVVSDHFSWVEFYQLLGELSGQRPDIRYGAPEHDFHHVIRRYSAARLVERLGFVSAYDWRDTLRTVFDPGA